MKYGWRLEAHKWQKLRHAARDCNWRRVYLERDYVSQVPARSGVYLICAAPDRIPVTGNIMERLYNAIYVGQASDLRSRFRQHVRGYRKVVCAMSIFRRLDFWYSEVPEADIGGLEQDLLDTLGPTANVKNVKARIGEPVPAGRTRGA